MLNRKEIEKRLKNVDPQLCIAFAARCSLRALPLLMEGKGNDVFCYWEDKSPQYILELLRAQQISINFSAVGGEINITSARAAARRVAKVADVSRAASARAETAAATWKAAAARNDEVIAKKDMVRANISRDIVRAVSAATYSATYSAAKASKGRFFAAAAYAAYYTSDAADKAKINLDDEVLRDLEMITGGNTISFACFLDSPLWGRAPTEAWGLLFKYFSQALLSFNMGFEPWVNWYKDRVDGKSLNKDLEDLWLNIPSETRDLGVKATNDYLSSLSINKQENILRPLNLVRAIFIGNGAAGKTSLIRRLNNEPVVEGKEEMTPGIEIREWSLPSSEIKAKFWDFGGQVMSHSTHQFFLRERCLYILVLDARTEFNANDQAEYWLEHVKAFGDNAPVMLVGNKSDLADVNLDMNTLREKYPNIVNFYPISCVNEGSDFTPLYDLFHDDLVDQLKAVGTHQVMFTPSQFKVLEQVRKLSRKDAFLTYDKFNDLCRQHGIGKVGLDQQAFLHLLDNLGEIIYFPYLGWANDYVLNPRWLTRGVYTLLYAKKTTQQQGELSGRDVIEILSEEEIKDEQGNQLTYPANKCRFIIDAMTNFKLSYRLEGSNRFIIPDKLLTEQPDLDEHFDKYAEGVLAIEFDFQGLLPRNIMPNLIVARYEEIIKESKGEQLVWQLGVVIHNLKYQATAQLQVDYHRRTLQLWVQGENPREYLVILRDEIYKIFSAIKGLSVKENVILPEYARVNEQHVFFDEERVEKAPYERLLKEARRGQKVTSSDSGIDYYLEQVMGFIMTKEQQDSETAKIENHFHGDAHIAVQSAGDHNDVLGGIKIVLSGSNKQDIIDLQDSLTALMSHLDKRELDILVKVNALAELQEINLHLGNIENITPESKSRVLQLLTNIKDGTLSAVKLGKEIKEAEKVITWLMEKAVTVSAFLAESPL